MASCKSHFRDNRTPRQLLGLSHTLPRPAGPRRPGSSQRRKLHLPAEAKGFAQRTNTAARQLCFPKELLSKRAVRTNLLPGEVDSSQPAVPALRATFAEQGVVTKGWALLYLNGYYFLLLFLWSC